MAKHQHKGFIASVQFDTKLTVPSGTIFLKLPSTSYHNSPHSPMIAPSATGSGLESRASGVSEQWHSFLHDSFLLQQNQQICLPPLRDFSPQSLCDNYDSIEYKNTYPKTLKFIFYVRQSSFYVFFSINYHKQHRHIVKRKIKYHKRAPKRTILKNSSPMLDFPVATISIFPIFPYSNFQCSYTNMYRCIFVTKLFIYLTAPGLSCSMKALQLQYVNSYL